MATTHYDVLGLEQDASFEQIKAAHRKLSLLLHPDKQQPKKSSISSNGEAEAILRQNQTKMSSLHDIDGDDDNNEDENADAESDQGNINEQLNNLTLGESKAQSGSSSSATEAKSGDGSNEASEIDKRGTDPSFSETTLKYTFRQIHTAFETLRDPIKRAAYDEDLALKTSKQASKVDKAVLIKLSDMEEILFEEEGGYYDGTGGRDQANYYDHDAEDLDPENCQVAYCYQCRCGDEIEVLQEELVETSDVKHSDESNVFECPSCCLCIRVEIDMALDEL